MVANENVLLFLSIVQTILLLSIAAGVAYLMYRSGRSPKGTRRSLHTRRREVYDDLVRILALLAKTGEIRKEELLDFRSRTLDATILFDPDIGAYIEEVYNRGVKLISTNEILKDTSLPIGEERDRITVENAKQTIWLADQTARLGRKFDRYLHAGSLTR